MNTWAVLAAQHAVLASGAGAGVVPATGAGSIDGFAVGALLSGIGMFMLTAGRERRRSLAAAVGGRLRPAIWRRNLEVKQAADRGSEVVVPVPDARQAGSAGPERRDAGREYQSRHRLNDRGSADQQPETRSKPRHAAPAASFSRRVSRLFTVRVLAGGVHS
jgi:hypothetical protein